MNQRTDLRLDLEVPTGPLRRSEGATLTVRLTNVGSQPAMVNRRMGPGYLESISREIYFDLDTEYGHRKYDRDLPGPSDYGLLEPGETISADIDVLAWYRNVEPGNYRLTCHYQADEPGTDPPEGIVRGMLVQPNGRGNGRLTHPIDSHTGLAVLPISGLVGIPISVRLGRCQVQPESVDTPNVPAGIVRISIRCLMPGIRSAPSAPWSTVGHGWFPMLYARVADRILLHGSTGAGALRHIAAGAPAALCVTHLDGWVYAHTLFDSSANYRSAVVHSNLVVLTGEEAARALTDLSDRILPGRSSEVPDHTRKQLAATRALAMNIIDGQWTVKIRDGGPGEPANPRDVPANLWTGVLPITSVYGDPVPAPWLTGDVPPSPSIQKLIATH